MTRHFNRTMLRLSLLLTAALFSAAGQALDSDRNAPVAIDADTTDIDFRTGTRTVSGNVDITQGSMNIKADKVILRYLGEQLESATAYGKPVRFKQMPEGQTEMVHGEGMTLNLQPDKDLVTLETNAKIHQGSNTMTGTVIYYNLKTSKMTVKGGTSTSGAARASSATDSGSKKAATQPGSGRTRIVIQPGALKKTLP